MEEIFRDNVQQHSLAIAKRIYTWEMLKLLRPILLKNIKQTSTLIPFAMLENYFKIAWRNLIKKKAYSVINIFGLALGIACCFLIFMFVQDELSFDNYHANGDRIYRVTHGSKSVDGFNRASYIHFGSGAMRQLAPRLVTNFRRSIRWFSFPGDRIFCSASETKLIRRMAFSLWIPRSLMYSVGIW